MIMHSRRVVCAAAIFFLLMSGPPDAWAKRVSEEAYRYPYKDPWIATSTVSLMQGKETIPDGDIRDLRIRILEGRDHPYLEGKDELRYRFYQQKTQAPLVFILPGIGSSAYAGSARQIAEFLAGHGFHVLVLPSPFHWNFALAASRSGLPGLIREDAEDMYRTMQLTLNEVRRRWRAQIGKIGLLGLSVGALNAAHVGELDTARHKIGISTYLLINPPVDLLKSIRRIDYMASLGDAYGENQRDYLESYALGLLGEALRKDPESPDYFLGWERKLGLTDRQIGYLIGKRMQRAVGDAVYAADLALNLGILRTPISWGDRTQRFREARSYTLTEYLKKILISRVRQLGNTRIDPDELNARNGLAATKTTLENNRNFFLMHNLDDFLLTDRDIAFLENTFGDRAIIYPHGGHLGNLWYSRNQKDILAIFKPLLD
jgi:pimeloyl-ACP methyl ester carboxylesterase